MFYLHSLYTACVIGVVVAVVVRYIDGVEVFAADVVNVEVTLLLLLLLLLLMLPLGILIVWRYLLLMLLMLR